MASIFTHGLLCHFGVSKHMSNANAGVLVYQAHGAPYTKVTLGFLRYTD
jgi:hypothetical protein